MSGHGKIALAAHNPEHNNRKSNNIPIFAFVKLFEIRSFAKWKIYKV